MEEKAVNNRFILCILGSAYALYSLVKVAQIYAAGGPDAPTKTMFLAAVAVLGGGALLVLWVGYKEWKTSKKKLRDKSNAAQADEDEEESL